MIQRKYRSLPLCTIYLHNLSLRKATVYTFPFIYPVLRYSPMSLHVPVCPCKSVFHKTPLIAKGLSVSHQAPDYVRLQYIELTSQQKIYMYLWSYYNQQIGHHNASFYVFHPNKIRSGKISNI